MKKFKIKKFLSTGIVTLMIISGLCSILNTGESRINNGKPCYIKETYMVPMRDGVRLATDVYLPYKGYPPHGSVLMRTPYNKDKINLGSWADAGWPSLVQDMRGRYASEGKDTVFRNAHTDGPDTLEWISKQNWSNGKIVTFGGSALGICQYFMAGANPPFLSCQAIYMATPDLYKHAVYQGGQFRKYLVEKWLEFQGSTYILPELFENENYTLEYWTNVSLKDKWGNVNVPAIHVGGWYDCFAQGTLDGFMGYQYKGGEGARGKSKLIMGPWVHGGQNRRKQGELIYPKNSLDTFTFDLFVDMAYQYAQNESNGFDDWPAVTYYVMGDVSGEDAPGNEWRYSDVWPVRSEEVKFYFHEDGTLSRSPPGSYKPITYEYDPKDPVPTLGGQNLILPSGPYDQRPVENREDVLVFTSPVLTKPLEATGSIKARLYVSSDCVDTDFTVKLTDVYPDGRSMLITDGILRMRNRNGFDHWDFMTPGEIYEVEVDLWSTSYVWNKGHRIRVAVSSSNYPRFLANPNTADGIYKNTTYNVAHNTLYLDKEHPSCIILPVVESKVSILKPKEGYLYIGDREIIPTLLGNTVIIGAITIEVDGYQLEKIEFYVDDELRYVDEESPYQWLWDEFAVGRHTLTVVAHDKNTNLIQDERDIIIFNMMKG